jgi:general stress protein CsbA
MAMQSAFHFCVLFFFLVCGFLFDERQRFRELLLACLAAVLCTYSLAGGFVSTLFLLVAFCVFKVIRARRAIDKERRRELLQLISVVGIVGSALIIWIVGFVKPPNHPAIVYPYTVKFWLFFVNLVSLAFGFMRVSTIIGILCLLIVLAPICGEIWRHRRDVSKLRWAPYVAVFGIFANIASISAGRAGFGLEQAKTDRYFEFVMALVMLSVINWAVFLRDKRSLKIAVLTGLWILCCASFARKWDFGLYRSSSAERLEGVRCVKAYYQGEGDGRCPTLYPDSLAPFLEQGKRLNASYYRDLNLVNRERKTGGNSQPDPNADAISFPVPGNRLAAEAIAPELFHVASQPGPQN